ncbi:non-ribosomal peptide synthetase [Streptomyces sp. NBC_01716]|uniref:non-ribosomal peptide synthetase n=1 Tax=Streptomyces sp. NBC_01716 TaxID=2975917 RepID=UPI002E30949D|nr:non-ribosomal peptide synthetase [Streptomyces sp. NBC_01716]
MPVTEAIERVCQENPEGSAIETAHGVLSYQEFGANVHEFAEELKRWTEPGEFIGIEANRAASSIVALAGALRARRPFVFIDTRDSTSSNSDKVSLLGVKRIAKTATSSPLPVLAGPPVDWCDDAKRRRDIAADLAPYRGSIGYAIHTSGSTGEPKCVLVRAEPLARMVGDHVRSLELVTQSRTLQFARLTFDGCITEILWTLTSGACLVITGEEQLIPGTVLQSTLEKYRITHLKTTPFALTATDPTNTMSLRHVINGGGACRPAVVQKWSPIAAFHNAYGTTESTVCNFLSPPLTPDDFTDYVPLGAVVGDCAYKILPLSTTAGEDTNEAASSHGELAITGESVAIGYLTPQGLHPFVDDESHRFYRTGDMVEERDGQLFFVERLDRQLKVRGFRLDPGEIESAACRLEGVMEAVVTAETYADTDDSVADALVCYYQGAVTARALRTHLETALDSYKVPSLIHQVEAMPYTRNGKVDRDALRARRQPEEDSSENVAPEEQILALVRRLTGVDDAGADDNFFDLGGDSASTVILVNKLKELGWVGAGVRDVLRAESLKALVDDLSGRGV